MRLGPPPEEPEIPGQFWIDFIRDTAPVFRKPTIEQLGEFIAPTFQALIDGAKYVQPRLEEIVDELEPDVDRRGQRRQLPGDHVDAPPVGPPPVLQPGGDQGPARRAVLVGLRGRDRIGLAGVPRRGRADAPRDVDRLRRLLPRARRAGGLAWTSTGPDFMHESPYLNAYSYPAEADYTRSAAARPDVAPAGLDGPRRGHDLAAARRAREPRRGADLPQPRQPRVSGRRPDAAARGPARADGPPRDRVEGAARGRDHAPRQHDRRGVPPAAGDPARRSTS